MSTNPKGTQRHPRTQSLIGPEGPAGPQGDTGATGATGAAGADGASATSVWTREIWFSANPMGDPGTGTYGVRTPSFLNATSPGTVDVMDNWANGATEGAAFSFCADPSLDTGADISARVFFRLSGAPGVSDTVEFVFTGVPTADRESNAAGTPVEVSVEVDVSGHSHGQDVNVSIGVVIERDTLETWDRFHGSIRRTGGTDSYGGTVQWYGLVLTGTFATA